MSEGDKCGARLGQMVDPVPIRKADPSFVEVYKTGFEEGKRAVDAQMSELESIRTRSMMFLAFIGAATSFLIGTSLGAATVSSWFFVLAVPATGLWLLTLILCLAVLMAPLRMRSLFTPWKWRSNPKLMVMNWQFRMNALSIISRPNPKPGTEGIGRPDSEADVFQALALRLQGMWQYNDAQMEKIRHRYWLFVVTGTVQMMMWTVLAWLYGTHGV